MAQVNHPQRLAICAGTPLQNSMTELWSLLHFMQPKRFDSVDRFLRKFGDLGSEGHERLKELHKMLRMYLLRREKEHVGWYTTPYVDPNAEPSAGFGEFTYIDTRRGCAPSPAPSACPELCAQVANQCTAECNPRRYGQQGGHGGDRPPPRREHGPRAEFGGTAR